MKNVVLIGASGFVGTAILNELLNRGHKVTAIVRDAKKMTVSNPNLTIVEADVTDTDALKEAGKGKDTVISAYNPGWKNPHIYEDTLKNYPLIVESAKQAGVKRLLIVGGAGTLFYAPGKMVMDADDVPAQLLPGIKSLGEFYLNTLRKEKDIDWIFLSPAANMTPGQRTAKFRIGKDDLVVDANGDSNISVEDFAVAMVDELEQEKHHKERFTIGY
ncbi:NAD(P)-dependent oxidoreductase [Bacteroides cellulosilyticus]|uniref:NAD(P)-dependent oxidoreductase n=1 Tax=Bacteroides cellulosilyticus TaxID=246787 RepID=UPI001C376FE7|nr:NAD(P)-dependent oxidoreductase [Bacteroides cellulosilyticus]MBV3639634.1 NAD(P)-dependent oxidoreductase [Bacteroides cellulosilyticus]MBV3665664.1 NAD(P)-dependent oxidoreductase [Bacteroides cellulosilyticus]MBV3687761.1 NAD(P)-dependent oxidoreductase [Bacteroides cellulosilyticus]MBV3696433.1 NAD(P)-dependent oxidoreductase [Bacteroides cellulosilyticus]MBV3710027.1 NAD(P)-dependent oxidoreductase [Bacteroides cellulosilyticus]